MHLHFVLYLFFGFCDVNAPRDCDNVQALYVGSYASYEGENGCKKHEDANTKCFLEVTYGNPR